MTAPLPEHGLIRIDRATCPEHGDALPEAFCTPFSVDLDMLGPGSLPLFDAFPMLCGTCVAELGLEQALMYPPELDWQRVDRPELQHWADIGHDPDARPQWYPLWEVRAARETVLPDGRRERMFLTGSRLKPTE